MIEVHQAIPYSFGICSMFGTVVLKEKKKKKERREGQFNSLKIKDKNLNNHIILLILKQKLALLFLSF